MRDPRLILLLIVALLPQVFSLWGAEAALETPGGAVRALGIETLREDLGVTGRGVSVAFIDTGVDPSHPALSHTAGGARRIIDWQDFTGKGSPEERAQGVGGSYLAEGDVVLRYEARATGNYLSTVRGPVRLGRLRSASGVYRYGFFRESQVDGGGPLGQDLDHSGQAGDEFLVVALDYARPGVYDVVYVDTAGDKDLRGEMAMRSFRQTGMVNRLSAPGSSGEPSLFTPFVLTYICPEGRLANLGFEANAHGTHVATVAAGRDPAGIIPEVAPGVTIMALKALRSGGEGSWENIARAMEYAAESGADIISVSVAGPAQDDFPAQEAAWVTRIARQHDVLIVLAAGNEGPGLGTIGAPGHPGSTLTVGGIMLPEVWRDLFGYQVTSPGAYFYGSVGPRGDGTPAPSLVAPGAALSAVPFWYASDGMAVMEGTSTAVPFVAGTAALLWEAARAGELEATGSLIKRALERGAARLEGVEGMEQGSGLLNAAAAWAWMREHSDWRPLDLTVVPSPLVPRDSGGGPPQAGTEVRRLPPEAEVFWVRNEGDSTARLYMEADDGVEHGPAYLTLPPGVDRRVEVYYDTGPSPGVTTRHLRGTGAGADDPQLEIHSSWIQPLHFRGQPDYALTLENAMEPGAVDRQYLYLEPGVSRWSLSWSVELEDGSPRGRARVMLFDPRGDRALDTGWLGAQAERSGLSREFARPMPGIWEVVTYSSPRLEKLGLERSYLAFESSLKEFVDSPENIHLSPDPSGSDALQADISWSWWGQGEVQPVLGGITPDPFPRGGERLEITPDGSSYLDFVLEGEARYLAVEIKNPTVETQLETFLYHYDRDTGLPREVARGGREQMVLEGAESGEYGLWVEAGQFPGRRGLIEVEWVALMEGGDVDLEEMQPGQLRLTAPALDSGYAGLGWRSAETGDLVHVVPIKISYGDDYVLSVAADRVPEGSERQVTVHVRDRATLFPATVPVEVNGKMFMALDGRVSVPVEASPPTVEMEVRVVPEDGQPGARRVFQLEVYGAP